MGVEFPSTWPSWQLFWRRPIRDRDCYPRPVAFLPLQPLAVSSPYLWLVQALILLAPTYDSWFISHYNQRKSRQRSLKLIPPSKPRHPKLSSNTSIKCLRISSRQRQLSMRRNYWWPICALIHLLHYPAPCLDGDRRPPRFPATTKEIRRLRNGRHLSLSAKTVGNCCTVILCHTRVFRHRRPRPKQEGKLGKLVMTF